MKKSIKKIVLDFSLIFVSICLMLISMFFDRNIEILMRIISFAINVYIAISNFIHFKENKKIINIVITIIGSILLLIFGFAIVDGISSTSKNNDSLKSEETYIQWAESLERSLEKSAMDYYDLEYFINNNLPRTIITKEQAEREFDEEYYELNKERLGTCDGYTIINVDYSKINEIIQRYKSYFGEYYTSDLIVNFDYDGVVNSITTDSYINCKGNYSYTTKNYDFNVSN